MQSTDRRAWPLVLSLSLTTGLFAQQRRLPTHEEPVDIQAVISGGLQTISVRTGERVIQDVQVKVTRRNNRRPVGAGLLVKARTPHDGPSATFGRGGQHEAEYLTNENGEFTIHGLLSNTVTGAYQLELTMNFVGQDRVHYTGKQTITLRNIKGGLPGWVKYVALAGAGGVAACFAGPCRPNGSGPGGGGGGGGAGPDATIAFGAGRVGQR